MRTNVNYGLNGWSDSSESRVVLNTYKEFGYEKLVNVKENGAFYDSIRKGINGSTFIITPKFSEIAKKYRYGHIVMKDLLNRLYFDPDLLALGYTDEYKASKLRPDIKTMQMYDSASSVPFTIHKERWNAKKVSTKLKNFKNNSNGVSATVEVVNATNIFRVNGVDKGSFTGHDYDVYAKHSKKTYQIKELSKKTSSFKIKLSKSQINKMVKKLKSKNIKIFIKKRGTDISKKLKSFKAKK
jgi:hypothetical protein